MNYKEKYEKWLAYEALDADLRRELEEIAKDEQEIAERFTQELAFGTAGLRGVIAAGSDRMNIYTVRRATQGLALQIKERGAENPSVIIGYDSRHKSAEFARETARVLAGNGIHVYLFDELKPVPMVSFGVRHLGCCAGIMITASHNPAKYNGYKVYGDDGAQLAPEIAGEVVSKINSLDIFTGAVLADFDEAEKSGLITMLGQAFEEEYLNEVYAQAINLDAVAKASAAGFKLVYTPFHGAGNLPVQKILSKIGLEHVYPVAEQQAPDGDFPTVKSPNPEDKEGFYLAINLAKEKKSDLIIGTDPDCDRVGVLCLDKKSGEYVALTGNQVGALLCEYILSQKAARGEMPQNPVVIKTIVTSEIIKKICDAYGVELQNVLTGFKFIGEKIKGFEKDGDKNFVFGFEESYGYLAGTYCRDKDGVVATMLVAEMAAFYSGKGMTLYDALQALFAKYGAYVESVKNIYREGLSGVAEIKKMMADARKNLPAEFAGVKVLAVRDYKTGQRRDMATGGVTPVDLPESDVLFFELEGGLWAVLRPSGTEPKLKIYTCVCAENEDAAREKADAILDALTKLL